ncbi:MAG: hypothetical protein HOK52_14815 [Candidatus Marinimicrobia bacterium]|jgi:hypothetical protein|nr:hypothetical protein [Candidatus Neomarinimicrobiota bacterium]
MKKVPSWLKGSVATHRGYETKAGELLKSIRLTQEQINEWNEVDTVVVEEPVVVVKEPVEEIYLKSKTKAELISIAERHGLEVNPKDTKADIIYILETLV